MIVPTTNLSIIDVRNAINYPSTDLGALCSAGSPYVNKWAKYKPVIYPFTYNRPTDWWRDPNGSCGLTIPVYTNVTSLFSDIDNNVPLWLYNKPMGGVNQPFRLGDFAGYNSNAPAPVFVSPLPSVWYADMQPTFSVSFGISQGSSDNTGDSLLLTDIDTSSYSLEDYYPGLLIKASNSPSIRLITSDRTLGQNANFIEIPASVFMTNTPYEICVILSSYSQTNFAPPTQSGTYIPLPNDNNIQTITFKTGGINIIIDAVFTSPTNGASNSFTYSIQFQNILSNTAVTFTNCLLRYSYSDKDPVTGTFEQGEGQIPIGSKTVNPGETVTVTGTVRNNPLPNFNSRGGNYALLYNYNNVNSFIYGQFEENQDQVNN